jgi:hypothetical protein
MAEARGERVGTGTLIILAFSATAGVLVQLSQIHPVDWLGQVDLRCHQIRQDV